MTNAEVTSATEVMMDEDVVKNNKSESEGEEKDLKSSSDDLSKTKSESKSRIPYEQRTVCCEYEGCDRRYSTAHSRRQHYRRHHKGVAKNKNIFLGVQSSSSEQYMKQDAYMMQNYYAYRKLPQHVSLQRSFSGEVRHTYSDGSENYGHPSNGQFYASFQQQQPTLNVPISGYVGPNGNVITQEQHQFLLLQQQQQQHQHQHQQQHHQHHHQQQQPYYHPHAHPSHPPQSQQHTLQRSFSSDVPTESNMESILIKTVKLGDYENVQKYLNNNEDKNHNLADSRGWTALHWASATGRSDLVTLLLQHKASPFIESLSGKTAIDLATLKNNSTVEILKEAMKFSPQHSPTIRNRLSNQHMKVGKSHSALHTTQSSPQLHNPDSTSCLMPGPLITAASTPNFNLTATPALSVPQEALGRGEHQLKYSTNFF